MRRFCSYARDSGEAVLSIGHEEVTLTVDSNLRGIQLDTPLYVGGTPSDVSSTLGSDNTALSLPPFNGCIRGLEFNGRAIPLSGKMKFVSP